MSSSSFLKHKAQEGLGTEEEGNALLATRQIRKITLHSTSYSLFVRAFLFL